MLNLRALLIVIAIIAPVLAFGESDASKCKSLIKTGSNKAATYCKKAAETGDVFAQYSLYVMHAKGQGVEKNYLLAFKWSGKTADTIVENKDEIDSNLAWIQKAADKGDIYAQLMIGSLIYRRDKNLAATVELIRKATEHGDPFAQFILGVFFCGESEYQDLNEAIKLFKAAEKSDPNVIIFHISAVIMNGDQQNYSEAAKLAKTAALKGNPLAQAFYGEMLLDGQGVKPDNIEAVKWLSKAAEQGIAEAQDKLGDCYSNGKGVPKNYSEAFKWYRNAAEQGYAPAQRSMGIAYEYGEGVTSDLVQSLAWYTIASSSDDETSTKWRDELEKKLTAKQITQAQQLAAKYQHQITQLIKRRGYKSFLDFADK